MPKEIDDHEQTRTQVGYYPRKVQEERKNKKKKKRPDGLNRNMHHRRMNARTQAQEGITNAQDMK